MILPITEHLTGTHVQPVGAQLAASAEEHLLGGTLRQFHIHLEAMVPIVQLEGLLQPFSKAEFKGWVARVQGNDYRPPGVHMPCSRLAG